jgi:hypothetical protein
MVEFANDMIPRAEKDKDRQQDVGDEEYLIPTLSYDSDGEMPQQWSQYSPTTGMAIVVL